MRQTAHRSRFFGDLVVDSYIELSLRRYGAEPADPQGPPVQPRPGHASAKKNRTERRSEAIEIRRLENVRSAW